MTTPSLPDTNKHADEHIARTAERALQRTIGLPDAIEVKVENGWITLSGTLDWDYQRAAAVDAVCNLLGVVGVRDQIDQRQRA